MTTPLTDERLQEIEARAEAATPGPWDTDTGGDVFTRNSAHKYNGLHDICERPHCPIDDDKLPQQFATMDFIAHARTDIPDLCAEVRRLRDELRLAEKATADACVWFGPLSDKGYCPICGGKIKEDGVGHIADCPYPALVAWDRHQYENHHHHL